MQKRERERERESIKRCTTLKAFVKKCATKLNSVTENKKFPSQRFKEWSVFQANQQRRPPIVNRYF